ncbi:MAG TPA: RHS repeat-associated core domain-containing protein [Oleiagrimonas sp.]|nr:RHS repeat-associated core domain-containing protein [Oleiagrimonas sp.]
MRFRKTISYKTLASLLVMVAYLVAGAAYAQQSNTVTTVTYVYTNAQGTPLAKADAQGNIIARYTYRPYGTQQSGPTNKGPGYTGHVNDPDTGLVYMQQRYYDPVMKRFISPDPISPMSGNIYNINRYAYANNNPIVNIDPDGRDTVGENINSAAQGCGRVTCAFYAAGHAVWTVFGAEGLSQVVDKGWSNVSTSDKVGAVTAVASVIPVGKVAGKVLGKLAEGAEAVNTAAHSAANGIRLQKQLGSAEQLADLVSGGGKAMAGAGTKTPIRDVGRLVKEYGGKASDWAKVTSQSRVASDGTRFETHAYRNVRTGELVEPKTKWQQ